MSWYRDRFISSFLINGKSQNSLFINVLSNIKIDNEIPVIVQRNGSRVEEVESDIHSISSNLPFPILFENCVDTQDSNSINIELLMYSYLTEKNPELHNLVKLYQLYRKSRRRWKYKNEGCRFEF